MKSKKPIRAALVSIAIVASVAATATAALANAPEPVKPDHVMTDPCARVMNWPHRALVALNTLPPSERGLQCPIEERSGGAPAEF
jgi:hypothetical protein